MAEWRCPEERCTKKLDMSDLEVFRVAVTSHMKVHGQDVQVKVVPARGRRELARDEVGEIAEDVVGHYVTITETGSSSGGFWRGFLDAFSFGGGSSSSGGSSKGSGGGGGGGGGFLDDLFG